MGSDRRARDILKELTTRRRLGERLWERLGRRGWGRPNVAVSDRIFKRFGVADPWDPDGTAKDEKPVGLGPVSLRLGPDRRQPAPHLKPKQPRKKSRGSGLPRGGGAPAPSPSSGGGPRFPPGFKPPVGVPSAKQTSKNRPPPPPPKRPTTELGKEFGAGNDGPRGLVGKLPVRPEVAARMKAAAEAKAAGEPPPKAVPLPKPARPPKPQKAPTQRRSRKPRVMQRNPNLPQPEAAAGAPPVNRRPPMPSRATGKRRGRFSMRPTEVTAAPVVTELPDPVVEVVATPEEAAPPPPPPARPAAPVSAGGLDDLFGFAAQEGRLRLNKPKKPKK